MPYEDLLQELFGDTSATGKHAATIDALIIDPTLLSNTPGTPIESTPGPVSTPEDSSSSRKRSGIEEPDQPLGRRVKRQQAVMASAINKLVDVMDKSIQKQAEQTESIVAKATNILIDEYNDQDSVWLLKAINVVADEVNASIFLVLLKKDSTLRYAWLESKMQ